MKLVRYPLVYDHGWQIDLHSLQNAVTSRTRGVIVVNPNNPTGHFVKAKEMQALNELCARRSLAIISDEVFLDFSLGQEKPLQFRGEWRSSDVYDERAFENRGAAADENGLGDRERAGDPEKASRR